MQQHMKNYSVLQKFQTSKEVSLVLNTTITFFFFLTDAISNFVSWTKLGISLKQFFLFTSSFSGFPYAYVPLFFYFFISNIEEQFGSDQS